MGDLEKARNLLNANDVSLLAALIRHFQNYKTLFSIFLFRTCNMSLH
jgi:hypothetical protein